MCAQTEGLENRWIIAKFQIIKEISLIIPSLQIIFQDHYITIPAETRQLFIGLCWKCSVTILENYL